MLLYDKHTMVELDRSSDHSPIEFVSAASAVLTPQLPPLVARKLAGWVGPLLHTWGHQLEQYSHNCPAAAG